MLQIEAYSEFNRNSRELQSSEMSMSVGYRDKLLTLRKFGRALHLCQHCVT
jgi:hypothetical protein